MVSTFSELLKREFGSKLGPTGDEYIGYTLQGALRMEQLLKDLRAYTLASTSDPVPVEDVDAVAMLDKALANLGASIRDSGASITRSDLAAREDFMNFRWSSFSRTWSATPSGTGARRFSADTCRGGPPGSRLALFGSG